MTTLIIQPSQYDTEIDSFNTTTNFGTAVEVKLHPESYAPHRGLLTFDLSSIPASAIISSATLSLNFTYHAVNGTITIYRIVRAWVETEATHIKATASIDWGTAGCENTSTDRSATAMGSTAISTTGWLDFVLNLTEFASMKSNNKGMRLSKTVPSSYDYSTFASRENATPTIRPKLTVVYTLPSALPSVRTLLGVGI